MKFFAVFGALIAVGTAPFLSAATPEDRYVEVYSWIEEGDQLFTDGQKGLAAEKYQEAQAGLKDLQRNYPNWNTNVVKFRLADVAAKLAPLAPWLAQTPEAGGTNFARGDVAGSGPEPDAEMRQLRQEVARLTKQNARLEARLREALSVQPASGDPRELARTAERLKQVEKERDLLWVSVEAQRVKSTRPASARGETSMSLEDRLAAALAAAKSAQDSTKEAVAERDDLAKKLEKVTGDLEKARNELNRRGDRGAVGNEGVRSRERETIATRLAAYESVPFPLEVRRSIPAAAPVLFAAADVPGIPRTVAVSTNSTTNGVAARKKYELPAGAGPLFAEVERAVDAGRYAEAEKKLLDILRQDEKNVRILDKLAAVQMDQDKPVDAEATLKKAIALDAEDPAALYLLGSLKLRQEKTDEALALLKLSATIEPEMPQTQYFLGRAYVQKGDRASGETALRKAIILKPSWGEPHYMLAVIYGTEEPVFKELSRFHYRKAIAGGAARNPELEKRIDNPATTATTPKP